MSMKSSIVTLLLALALVQPAMASDLKDELVAMQKAEWTAWGNHNAKAFGESTSNDVVAIYADGTVVIGRDKLLASVGSNTCKLNSFDFSDVILRQPSPDTAILTYSAKQDGSCPEGKLEPKLFATAIYVRQGGKWRSLNYQETVIK
jgi:hypothetical protein